MFLSFQKAKQKNDIPSFLGAISAALADSEAVIHGEKINLGQIFAILSKRVEKECETPLQKKKKNLLSQTN